MKKRMAKKIRKALCQQLAYVSIDTDRHARIEKTFFDAYNEPICLKEALERFRERTRYYQERVLADQIYRTRDSRNFCKESGIRLSGPKLG